MNPENHQLHALRTLILKSQSEPLGESEIVELNTLVRAEGGAQEAAALLDQLCAFSDSGSLDSSSVAEVFSEEFRVAAAAGTLAPGIVSVFPRDVAGALVRANAGRSPEPVGSSYQTDRWMKTYWWVGLAASHLFIALLAWSVAKHSLSEFWIANSRSAERTIETRPPQLVSMTACVWRPSGDLVPAIGEPIPTGEILNLVEGIAELRIGESTTGEALVRIEGPASVRVRTDGRLGFLQGSLTIKSLGIGSRNVVLETSIGTVHVDGQSSIGMVSGYSESEVHVFHGQVSVEPNQTASGTNEINLEEGEAVRISARSEGGFSIVKFEASEDNFASARSPGFDSLNLGEEYVRAVAESQPSIYWRFEELKGEYPGFVENQGSAPGMNANVVGNPGWRQYGDNRVVELGVSASSAFRALEPWPQEPLDEYAIEMWVKPLLFHHGEVICLHAGEPLEDGRYAHTMMLESVAQHFFTHRLSGLPENRFRFVHRKLRSNEPIQATSLFAEHEYQARVWQHVVAQKKGDRQMLFIDGQLSAEQSNPALLTGNVQILVGQVYPNSVYRRFVGQIDEVAIYERCLSPKELRGHIRAAGRKVASKVLN